MILRAYDSNDCGPLAQLFFDTVHTVNSKDYSKKQLEAWANGHIDLASWNNSFLKNTTLVAEIDQVIVGFGDMDQNGYLDRLYVHKDYQNEGIASKIVNKLENVMVSRGISVFSTHASITAIPFFTSKGYKITCENTVKRNDVLLINYLMHKKISK